MVKMGKLYRRNFGNTRIREEAQSQRVELMDKLEEESLSTYDIHYNQLSKSQRNIIRQKVLP